MSPSRQPPPAADDRVEYGYRLGPLIGPFIGLREHLALRSEALRSRGVDEAPSAQLSARYAELWGTADEEAARRRLLSFVACEALEPHWRMGALGLADTCARLEHGLRGLQARQTTLATEVALRRAVGTTDDE